MKIEICCKKLSCGLPCPMMKGHKGRCDITKPIMGELNHCVSDAIEHYQECSLIVKSIVRIANLEMELNEI